MATSSNSKEVNQPQFSLKHRLIGAGILISFGVLFLPWLLGSYSSEQKQIDSKIEKNIQPSSIATLATKAASKTVGNDKNSEKINDKKDVKVFVSRVQPLQSEQSKKDTRVRSTAVDKATTKKKDSKTKKTASPESKAKAKPKDKEIATKTSNKKVEKSVKKKAKASKPESKKEVAKKSEPASSASKNTNINRGYIVSVGVFGDVKNVKKMVSDLKSKSFNPSVREEKFNDKSVNRIYMGPFKTRAEAGKTKLRLSEKQNIPSLIKEFP